MKFYKNCFRNLQELGTERAKPMQCGFMLIIARKEM